MDGQKNPQENIVYTTRRKQVEKNPTERFSGKLDAPWTARSEGRTGSIYRTSLVAHWKKIIQNLLELHKNETSTVLWGGSSEICYEVGGNGTRKSDSLKQPV